MIPFKIPSASGTMSRSKSNRSFIWAAHGLSCVSFNKRLNQPKLSSQSHSLAPLMLAMAQIGVCLAPPDPT
jgi:hypothetical protein